MVCSRHVIYLTVDLRETHSALKQECTNILQLFLVERTLLPESCNQTRRYENVIIPQ
jgi:hypothetical protein